MSESAGEGVATPCYRDSRTLVTVVAVVDRPATHYRANASPQEDREGYCYDSRAQTVAAMKRGHHGPADGDATTEQPTTAARATEGHHAE
ncbi:hypothetical protein [Natrinema sp. DC36]|uniref:hypothetical protein n=1 Tax=Natrinema sp. DC36 TaxID=2878680 RepID=UPI001CF0277A|nr:hypothetical protein [Natrinema sp. DC36]